MKKNILSALFIIVNLICNNQLYAQEKDSLMVDELFEMSLDQLLNVEITTSSKSEQKAWEASAKVNVITQSMIIERGYFDLLDVLKDIPYFQIQSEYGHWMRGAIVNLRGHRSGDSGNNKFLLLIDGIKVSDEAEEGLYMGLNSIPLNSIKQIEIVYGPNSTLYGRDAYAGMINIITKTEGHKSAGYSYGTYNTHRLYAGLSQEFNDDVYGALHYFTYKSDEQDPTDKSITYKNRHVFPEHPYTERFYRGTNNSMLNMDFKFHGLSLKYVLFNVRASETYGCNPDFYVTEYSTVTELQNQIISAEYNRDLFSNLNLQVFYNNKKHELDPQTANLYTYDLQRSGVINFQDSSILVDSLYAYGGRKYYYFRTKTNNFGFKTTYQIIPKLKNISGVDVSLIKGIPIISEGKGGKPITTIKQREALEHDITTYGIYSEFTYNFTENILTSFGGRFDISSSYGNTFMPRIAFVCRNNYHLFKWIFSRGYLAPSITQRYFESITTFSWIKINEGLEPQKNLSLEFDWSYSRDLTHISTNVFYNKLTDGILESVQTGDSIDVEIGTEIFHVPILESQNISDGYRVGFSFELTQRISNYLDFNANYTYITGEDKIMNQTVQLHNNLSSDHTINSGLLFKYDKYSLYAGCQWFSERRIKSFHTNTKYSDFLDDEGFLNFDPVFLVNLNLRINNIWEGFSAFARVNNLFNKEYYGQTINANWGSPRILQDLRRIDIGIQYYLK